jgi:hypothetical protein
MMGSMSVGINLLESPPEELSELKTWLETFKRLRPDLQDAYVYLLRRLTGTPMQFSSMSTGPDRHHAVRVRPWPQFPAAAAPDPAARPAAGRGVHLRGRRSLSGRP